MDSHRGGGGFRGRGAYRGGKGNHSTPHYQKPPSNNVPYETNRCKC